MIARNSFEQVQASLINQADNQLHCHHCGQLVIGKGVGNGAGNSAANSISNSEHQIFCCEGCQSISKWLTHSHLSEYYDLLSQAGKQAPQAFLSKEYKAFLDSIKQPETLSKLGRWQGTRHQLTLSCEQISCAACAWLLEKLMQEKEGIQTFDVDFIHGEVFLEYDSEKISPYDILIIPAQIGYQLKPKNNLVEEKSSPDHTLLYRLAVSGFCFVNAMAFSLAVYLGAFNGMTTLWTQSFTGLGFLISLPAVAYAAFPFFKSAFTAIQSHRFNIDVTVSIGIFLSFTLSFYSTVTQQGLNYSDSLTGLIFFLLLGRWTTRKFESSLALKGRWFDAFRPGYIKVLRKEKWESVPSQEIKIGEKIQVLPGEYVPFDGNLNVTQAWMDTSLLTGESRATQFSNNQLVLAGFKNLKSEITLIVSQTFEHSRVAKLGQKLDDLVRGRRSIPDGVGQVAKWFTLLVIFCGLLTLIYHAHEGITQALASAASVFIISCACALALAAPISRGIGLKRAMQMGFHFKKQNSLEALKQIRCVLFDKTGTLTFTRRIVSAWKWDPSSNSVLEVESKVLSAIKNLAQRSLHPVAISLFHALESHSNPSWKLIESEEIPHYGMIGKFSIEPDSNTIYEVKICRAAAVLKISDADTCILLNNQPIAWVKFTDEIKPDVALMVTELQKRGVTSVLLSGDNDSKVKEFSILCGFQYFHSSLTPEEKRSWAIHYRDSLGPCLAVGDGFNDNLLFAESSMAMAIHGGAVDLSEATDILYTGVNPSDLNSVYDLGLRVSRSIKISFWVSGIYNVGAIGFAVIGKVSPLFAAVLMPMSSLSLCLVALIVIGRSRKKRLF